MRGPKHRAPLSVHGPLRQVTPRRAWCRARQKVSRFVYSSTTRGKYIDTTQFGMSTMELMRRSAQTLHSM